MVDKQQLAAIGEHMREMEECKPNFQVPDGWKLVPVEPTNDMLNAGYFTNNEANKSIYSSMLAAAPEYKP